MAAVKRKERVHIEQRPLEQERVHKRKVRKKRKKQNKAKARLKLALTFGAVAAATFVLLYRYSEISKVRYDIVGLEYKIEQATKHRDELNIELGEIRDSEWFVSEAQEKINLRKAEEGQFVTVKVPKSSQEAAAQNESSKSLFAGILDKFSR